MTVKFYNSSVTRDLDANQVSEPECTCTKFVPLFLFHILFSRIGATRELRSTRRKACLYPFCKTIFPPIHTVSVISPTEILQIEPGNFTASEKRWKSVGMIREIPSALQWPVNRQSKWRQQSSCTRMSVLCENHFKVIVRNSIFVVVLDCLMHSHFNSFQERL